MKRTISLVVWSLIFAGSPASAEDTLYCQGMVCSTTPPDQSRFGNIDVKDDTGKVVTTIWGSIDYYEQPNIKTETNNTTCSNCSFQVQPKPVYIESPISLPSVDSSTITIETSTVITNSSTALSDTATVVILLTKLTASDALALIDWNSPNVWEQIMVWIRLWFEELYAEQVVSQ